MEIAYDEIKAALERALVMEKYLKIYPQGLREQVILRIPTYKGSALEGMVGVMALSVYEYIEEKVELEKLR